MKETSEHTTSANGTYYATSCLGWATGRNPFEALGRLAKHSGLAFGGGDIKTGSEAYLRQTQFVNLWFIPDVDVWDSVVNYRPVDKNEKTCALPLYIGGDDSNEKVIAKHLGKAWASYDAVQKEVNESVRVKQKVSKKVSPFPEFQ